MSDSYTCFNRSIPLAASSAASSATWASSRRTALLAVRPEEPQPVQLEARVHDFITANLGEVVVRARDRTLERTAPRATLSPPSDVSLRRSRRCQRRSEAVFDRKERAMTLTISKRNTLSVTALVSLVGLAAVSAGCFASSEDTVRPRLDIIDQTKSALNAASISAITGTYGAGCSGRSALGTEPWTLSVSGGPAGDELSVRKNDSNCVLTIKSIVAGGGAFIGAPPIALDTIGTYKESGAAFALAGGPTAFYGNAKLGGLGFAADFTISLLVSSETSASAVDVAGATFATQSGTVAVGTVPASDYAISFACFGMQTDDRDVVRSVSGYAQLSAGSLGGQSYAVYEGTLTGSSTVAEVEAAFAAPITTGLLSALTTLRLPASEFGLSAVDLDTRPQRTVIIRNTDQGVPSYQLILVTFAPECAACDEHGDGDEHRPGHSHWVGP